MRITLTALMLLAASHIAHADSYDPATNQLMIPAITLSNGASYNNVVVTVGSVVSVNTGAAGSADAYDPVTNILTIPGITVAGTTYSNVKITVGNVLAATLVTPTGLLGNVSGDFRVNNFGWRPADSKIAVLLGHAGVPVQLLRSADNSVVAAYTSSAIQTESLYSGDQYSTVDFSAFSAPGDYYFYMPSTNLRSYGFKIAGNVYDIVGTVALKSYYFQRCNHDKVLPYASDALGGFSGHGGQWVDGICHASDYAALPGPGSADNGPLDLHGGWHDAGDYQKTLWDRGVPAMLFAYEMNPAAWKDGQTNIPESGNGIPDLLDEVKYELDFYLRMQRPDGHFMSSVNAVWSSATKYSPPSQSDEKRYYYDSSLPSTHASGYGAVTPATATGNAVLSLAHAAIVFRAAGQTATGDGYAAAAAKGWSWLSGQTLSGDDNRRKAAAAAAVFRMDPSNAAARKFAEDFPWDTWDGLIASEKVTPGENVISLGAWHYLLNTAGSAPVKANVRKGVAEALVDNALKSNGPYGGMAGDSTNAWDWSWGSNREQSYYGFNLMMAARQGVFGSPNPDGTYPADENKLRFMAQKHLHFLLGLNPLNMVYLTNMAAYGGEHSSFQTYHGWFSYTDNDGDHGNAQFNGKPAWVNEPLYPYYVDDTQMSIYGPAPGLLVGGPNRGYTGSYTIPSKSWPAYAYRDFSVGFGVPNASGVGAVSYELTEPDVNYQAPFLALVSFFMSGQ